MDENIPEEEPRERCKEALFVDDKSAELIQRVTAVMAIADELRTKDIIHGEKYEEIKAEKTNQEKMRRLFESLNSGGDDVKRVFYYLLEKHEPHLFKDLGGFNRKRKQDENLDDPVPSKRFNTGSNNYHTHNYNNASNSAAEPAPTYKVTHIINQSIPPNNMDNVAIIKPIVMTPWTPASEREKKLSAPNKGKKHPALVQRKFPNPVQVNKPPKKEKKSATKQEKPPAPKKEKKSPAPKKEKKPPAPKKENKSPTSKKNKPPASKIENKSPAPKKDKPTAPKKEKKAPAPKKEKKPPAPKKEKNPPAPKKEKKPPAPKKEKKPPAPKKEKKPPAPKKEKKPPAPKKQKPPAPKKQKPPAPKKQKPPAPKKQKPPAHK
ncbi:uncharacterized protein LOC130247547 [Danio aesculapii]|uniref:uncharacterized protein LOC130247547 n=1 Tax=Danio aesculapii TaxID=1142201 RepID=UPI0024BF199E|nr:uncharacterized protein LOC130247547 [Danio aesculapii]